MVNHKRYQHVEEVFGMAGDSKITNNEQSRARKVISSGI
jgi:hypothetical protein